MLLRFARGSIAAAFALICVLPMKAQLGSVKTIFVIALENHNWDQFKGAPNAPYLNNVLLPRASYAEQYYSPPGVGPSLPNYLWREAGTNYGIDDDNDPSANHQSSTAHLVTQLKNASILWKTYQEDISGATCPLVRENLYAPKHNPFVYFDDVTNSNDPHSVYCIAHVRPFIEMFNDLQNNTVANYVFITPNLCNDGHDACAPVNDEVRQTDNWLAANVPAILSSTAYQSGGAIFITWDEGEGSYAPIGLIVISPYAKGGGYSNSIHYTHGSLLRTVEEIFGVGLLGDASVQKDLGDLFAVTRLSATAGNQQVTLNWNPIAGAASYNVKRGTASGGPYGTLVASGIQWTSYTDNKVVNETTYHYVVTGINATGETSNSSEASAKPTVGPIINAVVNGASFHSSAAAAPGSIISVFGTGFGAQDNLAAFPSTSVNGVSVLLGNTPAPIFALAATSGQINVLVPTELPSNGSVNLEVQAASGVSSAQSLNRVPAAPGIFFYTDPLVPTRRNAAAVTANTAWIAMPLSMAPSMGLPTNCSALGASAYCVQPAHPGDYLQIYVTGLGAATPNGDSNGAVLPTGSVAPISGNPLFRTLLTPRVAIGGQELPVLFSGIAPGYAGLYQINVQIPASITLGDDVRIQISMAGFSDLATIAIQ